MTEGTVTTDQVKPLIPKHVGHCVNCGTVYEAAVPLTLCETCHRPVDELWEDSSSPTI